jgi:hypothetical protein
VQGLLWQRVEVENNGGRVGIGFIIDDDSAFGEKVLYIPEVHAETMIEQAKARTYGRTPQRSRSQLDRSCLPSKRPAYPLKVLSTAEKVCPAFERCARTFKSPGTSFEDSPGGQKSLSTAGKVVAQFLKVFLLSKNTAGP